MLYRSSCCCAYDEATCLITGAELITSLLPRLSRFSLVLSPLLSPLPVLCSAANCLACHQYHCCVPPLPPLPRVSAANYLASPSCSRR